MAMININDLHKKRLDKEQRRKGVFEDILKRCHTKIKNIADSEEICYCFFKVPLYVYGNPLYDIKSCIIYLVKSLIRNGFDIKYYHPYLIYISWFEKENPKSYNEPKVIQKPKTYNSINAYKPSGNFVYNNNSLNLFERKSNKYLN